MTDITVVHVAPDSLIPAPYNPRTMSEEARARLKRGIVEFGMVDPLVARRSDRMIIGGHQRHAVALDLGLATVPVVFLDDLDDHKAATLNVLLNNPNAQGEWDSGKLTGLLTFLKDAGADLTLTGFSELDFQNMEHDLLDPEDAGASSDRAAKLLGMANVVIGEHRHKVHHGEHWKVGPHDLVCASVFGEWSKWVPLLRPSSVLVPFPGPFITVVERLEHEHMVLVQPNAYIAAHILDRAAEQRPTWTIAKQ